MVPQVNSARTGTITRHVEHLRERLSVVQALLVVELRRSFENLPPFNPDLHPRANGKFVGTGGSQLMGSLKGKSLGDQLATTRAAVKAGDAKTREHTAALAAAKAAKQQATADRKAAPDAKSATKASARERAATAQVKAAQKTLSDHKAAHQETLLVHQKVLSHANANLASAARDEQFKAGRASNKSQSQGKDTPEDKAATKAFAAEARQHSSAARQYSKAQTSIQKEQDAVSKRAGVTSVKYAG